MTYEFKCDRCGETYDIHARITSSVPDAFPHDNCPASDHDIHGVFRRVVTGGVGTIFVGGGWTPRSGE